MVRTQGVVLRQGLVFNGGGQVGNPSVGQAKHTHFHIQSRQRQLVCELR